jgi:type IV pilus assembly protein PilV
MVICAKITIPSGCLAQFILTNLSKLLMQSIAGLTLLEVMISMLLLALALFAMDFLALESLRENRQSYFYSVATNELQNMSEYLQTSGRVDQSKRWQAEVATVLPQGTGLVDGNFPDYELTVFWGNKDHSVCRISNSCISVPMHVTVLHS